MRICINMCVNKYVYINVKNSVYIHLYTKTIVTIGNHQMHLASRCAAASRFPFFFLPKSKSLVFFAMQWVDRRCSYGIMIRTPLRKLKSIKIIEMQLVFSVASTYNESGIAGELNSIGIMSTQYLQFQRMDSPNPVHALFLETVPKNLNIHCFITC